VAVVVVAGLLAAGPARGRQADKPARAGEGAPPAADARQPGESVAVLFEKAVQAERTEGNLDAAAKLYEQVASQAASDRKLAADATLRLAKVEIKRKQPAAALKAFQRLKTEYADQKAANADAAREMARANLSLEPAVQKAEPAAFADNVDPSVSEIKVTFNQAMADRSWSWCGSGEHYPEIVGDGPKYDEAKTTCTLPVKLEPGKVYRLGINAPSFRNFKSADGVPARCYQLLFATKDADGKPTRIPPAMLAETKVYNAAAAKGDPVILKTNPVAFNDKVPASLSKITVTFNQPMLDKNWSWTGGGDTYPKLNGKPSYDAAKTTCTLPVKLEPGKAYWVGVNSPSFQNFQNPAQMPAPWHVIVFATAGADGKPTPIPADMLAEAKRINAAGDEGAAPADDAEKKPDAQAKR
jgi:hypothetical protein